MLAGRVGGGGGAGRAARAWVWARLRELGDAGTAGPAPTERASATGGAAWEAVGRTARMAASVRNDFTWILRSGAGPHVRARDRHGTASVPAGSRAIGRGPAGPPIRRAGVVAIRAVRRLGGPPTGPCKPRCAPRQVPVRHDPAAGGPASRPPLGRSVQAIPSRTDRRLASRGSRLGLPRSGRRRRTRAGGTDSSGSWPPATCTPGSASRRTPDAAAISAAAEAKRREIAGTPMPQNKRAIEKAFCDQGEKALLRPDIRREYDALLHAARSPARAATAASRAVSRARGAPARRARPHRALRRRRRAHGARAT